VHHDVPELYDVIADPGEQRDRASEEPVQVAALRAELERLLADAAHTPAAAVPITDEDRTQLEALGYVVPTDAAPDAATRHPRIPPAQSNHRCRS
jgi:hypothetical protein